MDPLMLGFSAIGIMFVLFMLGVQIGISMALVGFFGVLFMTGNLAACDVDHEDHPVLCRGEFQLYGHAAVHPHGAVLFLRRHRRGCLPRAAQYGDGQTAGRVGDRHGLGLVHLRRGQRIGLCRGGRLHQDRPSGDGEGQLQYQIQLRLHRSVPARWPC